MKKFLWGTLSTLLIVHTASAGTWGDIGTVGTLTSNKLCYTDGTDIVCDASLTVNGAQTLEVTGSVSATSFIGDGSSLTGVNASGANWYGLTNIPTGVSAVSNTELGTAELQQLQNVDTTTVSTAQWGYLGAMDQGVATTDTPTFAGLNTAGTVSATAFVGDGSGLTGLGSDNIQTGDTSVSIVDSGTGNIHLDVDGIRSITIAESTVDISASVKVAGTGSEACAGATDLGKMRWNPSTQKFQICRQ